MIWKDCFLQHLIDSEEAVNKAESLARILHLMDVHNVESIEDFRETEWVATECGLTFYDASYLHLAKSKDCTLVTDDKELRDKAAHIGLSAISCDEFIQQTSASD